MCEVPLKNRQYLHNSQYSTQGNIKRTTSFSLCRVCLLKDQEFRRLLVLEIIPRLCLGVMYLRTLQHSIGVYVICFQQIARKYAGRIAERKRPVS